MFLCKYHRRKHAGQADDELKIAKGVTVQLVHLTQDSLNGCSGEVVDYVEKSNRWTIQVQVNGNKTTMNIKAENLIVIKSETAQTMPTVREFDMGQWKPGHGRWGGEVHGKHEKEAECNAERPIFFNGCASPTYHVFVTFRHGVTKPFGVHPGTTVGGLKYLVYLQTDSQEFRLQLMSKPDKAGKVTAVDTEATLYDCGFGTESTIQALLYIEVTVQMLTGKTYKFQVVPETRMDELKLVVQKILCLPTACLQFVLVNRIQRRPSGPSSTTLA